MSKLILVTGMRRSGSTLLYNIIKEILLENEKPLYSPSSINGYDDYDNTNESEYHLIKLHLFEKKWIEQATYILNTKRDIRQVMASEKLFNIPVPITRANFIRQCLNNLHYYNSFKEHASFDFKYETYLNNPDKYILEIGEHLGFFNLDTKKIITSIKERYKEVKGKLLRRQMDQDSFMYSNHITNPTGLGFERYLMPKNYRCSKKKKVFKLGCTKTDIKGE